MRDNINNNAKEEFVPWETMSMIMLMSTYNEERNIVKEK